MELSATKIKKFLIFWEMELSCSNIKKILIFSQKEASLIFREIETLKKNFLYFKKQNFLTLWGRKPKKLLIFQEVTFRAQKNKKI